MNWDRFCAGLRKVHFDGVMSLETFNSFHHFPQAVWPELLKLEAATARHLAEKSEAEAGLRPEAQKSPPLYPKPESHPGPRKSARRLIPRAFSAFPASLRALGTARPAVKSRYNRDNGFSGKPENEAEDAIFLLQRRLIWLE